MLVDGASISSNWSNHFLRSTTATRLHNKGFSEQVVQEATGHRSNAVHHYSRRNYIMKEKISNKLNVLPKGVVKGHTDENQKVKVVRKTSVESSKQEEESMVKIEQVKPTDLKVALPSSLRDLASVAGDLVNIHFHFNK